MGSTKENSGNSAINRLGAFCALDESELTYLKSLALADCSVSKGETIDHADAMHTPKLLLEGWAATVVPSSQGQQSLIALNLPGEMIGIHASVLTEPFDHTLALTDIRYIPLESSGFQDLFEQQPRLAALLLSISLEERASHIEWISMMRHNGAEARFATFLVRLGERLETLGLGSKTEFEIPLTHSQIADAIGVSAVYISQMLKRFVGRDLIQVTRKYWRLSDLEALQDIAAISAWEIQAPKWLPKGPSGRTHS